MCGLKEIKYKTRLKIGGGGKECLKVATLSRDQAPHHNFRAASRGAQAWHRPKEEKQAEPVFWFLFHGGAGATIPKQQKQLTEESTVEHDFWLASPPLSRIEISNSTHT